MGNGRRIFALFLVAVAAGMTLSAAPAEKGAGGASVAPAVSAPSLNAADRTAALEQEVTRLRVELQKKEAELARMRVWLGGMADAGKRLSASDREMRQLRAIETLASSGIALVLKAGEVSRQLRTFLTPLSPAERAQILLRLEELEAAARGFNLAADLWENPRLEHCRVLAVNPELGVVALSVGAFSGAAPGMVYRRDGFEVRLISVRPYASAAVVQKGVLKDIFPGMEFSSSEAVHTNVMVFGK